MTYSKEVKELKVIMTDANGTIKTSIFTIGKGQIESMLIIITTVSNITNRERKRPTRNHNNNIKNNNQQQFECLINTRPQNTTTNTNLKQTI